MPLHPPDRRRTSFRSGSRAAAFCLILACGATLGLNMPKSQGQGLFELLFGGFQQQQHRPQSARAPARSTGREWRASSRPLAHQFIARRQERRVGGRPVSRRREPAAAVEPTAVGARSYCVRECDGYFFPVGTYSGASDLPNHQRTCNKLCPGAKSTLYIMRAGSDKIEEAVTARGGSLYSRLTAALQRRGDLDRPCSCRAETAAAPANTIYEDFTLRRGDAVMTPRGVAIFHGGSHYPYDARDFRSLAETRDVPERTRRMLAVLERANRHGRGGEVRRAGRPLGEHRSQSGGGDRR